MAPAARAALLLLVALAAAAPLPRSPPQHRHPALAENGGLWRHAGAPRADEEHSFLLLLRPRNAQLLPQLVRAVSTPGSPQYRQYYTVDALSRLVAPEARVRGALREALQRRGATRLAFSRVGDSVRVRMPVAAVEELFDVKLRRFVHADGRVLVRAIEGYALPEELLEAVALVRGVSDLPLVRRRRARSASRVSAAADPEQLLADEAAAMRGARWEVPAASGGGAVVTAAKSRSPFFYATFIPICANGAPSTANPPCSDAPPAVVGAVVAATAQFGSGFAPQRFTVPAAKLTCRPASPPDTNFTLCNAYVSDYEAWGVPLYAPLNISVSPLFADGSMGASGQNAFPVVYQQPLGPDAIAALYRVPQGLAGSQGSQCVVEFEEQYYDDADLQAFLQLFGVNNNQTVTVIGPNDPTEPGGEALLDIQYIMGLAPGVPTTFWSIKANSSVEIDDILSWALAVADMDDPPLVNSISYGMSSAQVNVYQGPGYLERSDLEFQKLALRGLTILISSGDTGAGDLGPPPMSEPTCDRLHPDWPSESPYVTSVGSTLVTRFAKPVCFTGGMDCRAEPLGEVAVSLEQGVLFTSGGGFSENNAAPFFQAADVASYLQRAAAAGLLPPATVFNASGRAYPDVSTVGHNLMIVSQGQVAAVDGTSASAPVFAALVSLLNSATIARGSPPLGFLNPLLYYAASAAPGSLYDVTVGANRCGAYGWTPTCCAQAFTALPGFDPVAGLGSPNFELLDQLVGSFDSGRRV